jgi:hypothetical protein
MGSFEWMELQTLTSEIAHARSRLAAARKSRDTRRARSLEEEIAAAEGRRENLLAHITTNLVSAPAGAAPAAAVENEETDPPVMDLVEEADPEPADPQPADPEPQPVEPVEPTAASGDAPPAAVTAGSVEGDTIVWDQLTPNDLEHARNALGARRTEMLARHAEELKAVEADQTQLETLEQAIAAFAAKFNMSARADVVKLDDEREMRHQGRA